MFYRLIIQLFTLLVTSLRITYYIIYYLGNLLQEFEVVKYGQLAIYVISYSYHQLTYE